MQDVDSEEDSDAGQSWISVKSLKEAAELRTVFKKQSRKSSKNSSTSPSPSHNSSITMEWKPNTFINQSASFCYIHENYRHEPDIYTPSSKSMIPHSEPTLLQTQLYQTEQRYRKLYAQYERDVRLLNEQLVDANNELAIAHQEISKAALEKARIQQEYALRLQNMQAHHERKMQRSKQDLDILLSEINEKAAMDLTSKIQEEHRQEIHKLRDEYEEKIEQLKTEHEIELQEKEEDFEKAIAELQDKLSHKGEFSKFKYDEVVKEIEKKLRQEYELVYNNTKEPVKSSTLALDPSRFRKVKDTSPIFPIPEDSNSSDLELKSKILEQQKIIDQQEKTIQSLTSQLQDTYRKKKFRKSMADSELDDTSIFDEMKSLFATLR